MSKHESHTDELSVAMLDVLSSPAHATIWLYSPCNTGKTMAVCDAHVHHLREYYGHSSMVVRETIKQQGALKCLFCEEYQSEL